MRSVILCLGLSGRLALAQLVNVGDHRLFVHCTGQPSEMAVVLENGLGAGLETWKAVQSNVEGFSKVCSYDRAGEGHSDKPSQPPTPDAVVTDLYRLLESERLGGPYVLVGASLGGIYVRRFALRYPDLTANIVLVDSSHEGQYNHYDCDLPYAGRTLRDPGRPIR